MRRLIALIPLLLALPILVIDFLYNFIYGKLSPKGYPKQLFKTGNVHISKALVNRNGEFTSLLLARLEFGKTTKHIIKNVHKSIKLPDEEIETLAYESLTMYYLTFVKEAEGYQLAKHKTLFSEKNSEKLKYIMEHCANYEKVFITSNSRIADIQLLMVSVIALLNKRELVISALNNSSLVNYQGKYKALHSYLNRAFRQNKDTDPFQNSKPIETLHLIEKLMIDNNLLGVS